MEWFAIYIVHIIEMGLNGIHNTMLGGRKECLFDKEGKSVSVFRLGQRQRRSKRKTVESPGCLLNKIDSIFMWVS